MKSKFLKNSFLKGKITYQISHIKNMYTEKLKYEIE
jgi:hypothetical protein